jgi:hypothetical protein
MIPKRRRRSLTHSAAALHIRGRGRGDQSLVTSSATSGWGGRCGARAELDRIRCWHVLRLVLPGEEDRTSRDAGRSGFAFSS